MAVKKPKISIRGAKKEALQNREFDANRRDSARNILSPDQIQGKAWRATKVLTTTMGIKPGEEPRAITKADLIAFNRNIKALQTKVEPRQRMKRLPMEPSPPTIETQREQEENGKPVSDSPP
jgi:hypothetical protein